MKRFLLVYYALEYYLLGKQKSEYLHLRVGTITRALNFHVLELHKSVYKIIIPAK